MKLRQFLEHVEKLENPIETLLEQPKFLDRLFNDAKMNDLTMLNKFFRLLQRSMVQQRSRTVEIITRIPDSQLLTFVYQHLKPTNISPEYLDQLHNFVDVFIEVISMLIIIHPLSSESLDSNGIFDRLEKYNEKYANDELKSKIVDLISKRDESQKTNQKESKKKKEEEEEEEFVDESEEPPPDDFHQLSVYPTIDEILHNDYPYLRRNIVKGSYTSGTHYLDIHFRLLREDFLSPLRGAICEYIANDKQQLPLKNLNVRFYHKVTFLNSDCSPLGLLYSLLLDRKSLPKSINWSSSRRLIYGNLLAATLDGFATTCFLLTVEDRAEVETTGVIRVRCQKQLTDHKFINLTPGTVLTLLETTSYFEAYRPILQALQNITDDRLPLEQYLLHCNRDVALPAYFEAKKDIDFRPLIKKDCPLNERPIDHVSDVKDFSTWPLAEQMGLDESQYAALKLALTKSVALIQGPPGCGKTYLGVRLTELFYHNRQGIIGCQKPILMICYTNHALDQFLTSIIQKLSLTPGEVVRVGGRSNEAEILPFLIQKLRHTKQDVARRSEYISNCYDLIDELKKKLEKCTEEFYQSSETLLSTQRLLTVMDRQQFLNFIDPIYYRLEIFNQHWNLNKGGLYCCRSTKHKSDDDDSDDNNDKNNDNDDELSFEEKQQRMRNRVHCQKINNLSEEDQKIIHEHFVQWLGASHLEMITIKPDDTVKDDDNEGFQEVKDKRSRKQKNLAQKILRELFSDSTFKESEPKTTASAENTAEAEPVNLEDDEEEKLRLENVDSSMIPLRNTSRNNREKREPSINPQQMESIRKLLSNEDSVWTDEKVKNISNFWELNKGERQQLYRYWLTKSLKSLRKEWVAYNEDYDEYHQLLQKLWLADDQKYMSKAFIVAMTTHCASRYQGILKALGPRICIVEEAAEVFESHIITAIGENIEHLILIGDHVQLRPSANVYKLAKCFKLDVSLFERLIKNNMPSVQLQVQHRSIPRISSLTHHFYDIPISHHESVLDRPPIRGVVHPLFFITHQRNEENVADGASKRNVFECDYALQLASYLVQQGYETNEITILTTYMGQRQLIQNTLRNRFSKLKGIHNTVVDNYQGEENHIVILSLVRSNLENNLGYTAVENRICVALSRAQNGFYVLGNFHMFVARSEAWKTIIDKVKEMKLIGTGLPICCPNHTEKQMICDVPTHFLQRPLGGCGLPCETRLPCGHQCRYTCHFISHEKVKCESLCRKTYSDCEHRCPRRCHAPKDCLPCSEMISLKMPNCDHISDVPCFMRKANKLECGVLLPHTCRIGHEVQVKCYDLRNPKLRNKICNEPCNALLKCGHKCSGTCSTCLEGRFHLPCREQETIVFICGHTQKQPCGEWGAGCQEKFIKICEHEDEPPENKLNETCQIHSCSRFCKNKCKHSKCSLRCQQQCNREVCYEKCTRKFPCEHYCNRICGESCLDCLMCRRQSLPRNIQQELSGKNIRYAIFVEFECKHIMSMNEFDDYFKDFEKTIFLDNGWMKIDYPRCPQCQHSLVKLQRLAPLMKKIHHHQLKASTPVLRLTDSLTSRSIDALGLPENISQILNRYVNQPKYINQTALFLKILSRFANLNDMNGVFRDRIVQRIYEHVEQKNSILFTLQQWIDLENECNRLLCIRDFEALSESLSTIDSSNWDTINDLLYGPNGFGRLAAETFFQLLGQDANGENQWIPILTDESDWTNLQKYRFMCDGKWFLCPQAKHYLWSATPPNDGSCAECAKSESTSRATRFRSPARNHRSDSTTNNRVPYPRSGHMSKNDDD